MAVNVSDLEAMGCRPSSVVVALAFPKDLNPQWVVDFHDEPERQLPPLAPVGTGTVSGPRRAQR